MRDLFLFEVLLAIVAVRKRVQREVSPFRRKRQQMRGQRRVLDHVIHPRLSHFDIGTTTISLYVRSRGVAQGRAVLKKIDPDRLLGIVFAHDGVDRPSMIPKRRFVLVLIRRGNAIVVGAPTAVENYASIGRLLGGFEVNHISILVLFAILERTASKPVSDVGFVSHASALGKKSVLVRLRRNTRNFGMLRQQQLANLGFHGCVIAFAFDVHRDVSSGIDEVAIGPRLGLVGFPDRAIHIGHNRPRQLKSLRGATNILRLISDGELPKVDADDLESIRMIFGVPALEHSKVANAVDAGVLPEIDKHDASAICLDRMRHLRAAVEPDCVERKIRRTFGPAHCCYKKERKEKGEKESHTFPRLSSSEFMQSVSLTKFLALTLFYDRAL